MNVGYCRCREIVVDNQVYSFKINSTAHELCSNKDPDLMGKEQEKRRKEEINMHCFQEIYGVIDFLSLPPSFVVVVVVFLFFVFFGGGALFLGGPKGYLVKLSLLPGVRHFHQNLRAVKIAENDTHFTLPVLKDFTTLSR